MKLNLITMKRQAEESAETLYAETTYDGMPPSPPSSIQNSPVKLLNTSMTLKGKKPRSDETFPGNELTLPEDASDANPSPKSGLDSDSDNYKNSGSPTTLPQQFPCVWIGGASPSRPAEATLSPRGPSEDEEERSPMKPTAPMNGNFPCIWVGGVSPSRAPEHIEVPVVHAAAAETNESPRNGHKTPEIPISMPNMTKVPASMTPPSGMSSLLDNDPNSVEVCPECNKVFKRKVYLQRHMEREHWSTAKVFKCDDCSYETKHQSNLSVHRRIHTGERPYHCGVCGQRYTQGHLLKSHIRSRHGGNMEYYNLDKKSDSTRGRKSLDMKHDPTRSNDKISSLLQAAGISDFGGHKPTQLPYSSNPVHQQMNVFMNGMNGGLSPYFGSMRPLMSNSMLPGMLPSLPGSAAAAAASHRFLAMGGLGGGLGNHLLPLPGLPGLPQPAQMEMPHETLMSSSMPLSGDRSRDIINGMKIPLKVPEVSSRPTTNGGVHIEEIEDSSVPQDLSTKSPATFSSDAEPTDYSSNRDATSPKTNGETESISSPEPAATENGYQTDETRSSATPIEIKPHHHHHHRDRESKADSEDDDLDETMDLSRKEIPPFCSSYCSHAKKLRLLRKSVVHMLSVLTPGLNMENGLDYDSDAVDELLHEVIYSNMDDVLDGKD